MEAFGPGQWSAVVGLSVCEAVADRMASLCGWDAALRQRNVDEYRFEVELSRRWKTGAA